MVNLPCYKTVIKITNETNPGVFFEFNKSATSVFGKQKEVQCFVEPTTPTDLVHPQKRHAKKSNGCTVSVSKDTFF